jgi:hypothetical protein
VSVVPRIYRARPQGPVTTADPPIDVIATLHWTTSDPTDTPARAIAWTRTEVQVEWQFNDQPRRDWIEAGNVRRPGQPLAQTPPTGRTRNGFPHLDTRRRPHP